MSRSVAKPTLHRVCDYFSLDFTSFAIANDCTNLDFSLKPGLDFAQVLERFGRPGIHLIRN